MVQACQTVENLRLLVLKPVRIPNKCNVFSSRLSVEWGLHNCYMMKLFYYVHLECLVFTFSTSLTCQSWSCWNCAFLKLAQFMLPFVHSAKISAAQPTMFSRSLYELKLFYYLMMKPWLDIALNQNKNLWTKYVDNDMEFVQMCNFGL